MPLNLLMDQIRPSRYHLTPEVRHAHSGSRKLFAAVIVVAASGTAEAAASSFETIYSFTGGTDGFNRWHD
jgi:hypothetical protein